MDNNQYNSYVFFLITNPSIIFASGPGPGPSPGTGPKMVLVLGLVPIMFLVSALVPVLVQSQSVFHLRDDWVTVDSTSLEVGLIATKLVIALFLKAFSLTGVCHDGR